MCKLLWDAALFHHPYLSKPRATSCLPRAKSVIFRLFDVNVNRYVAARWRKCFCEPRAFLPRAFPAIQLFLQIIVERMVCEFFRYCFSRKTVFRYYIRKMYNGDRNLSRQTKLSSVELLQHLALPSRKLTCVSMQRKLAIIPLIVLRKEKMYNIKATWD